MEGRRRGREEIKDVTPTRATPTLILTAYLGLDSVENVEMVFFDNAAPPEPAPPGEGDEQDNAAPPEPAPPASVTETTKLHPDGSAGATSAPTTAGATSAPTTGATIRTCYKQVIMWNGEGN